MDILCKVSAMENYEETIAKLIHVTILVLIGFTLRLLYCAIYPTQHFSSKRWTER
jgi:hypothetical protein